jgi:hypothetical protein
MTLLDLLRDALARVVWIREEFDPIVREQALEDLEHDLAGQLARIEHGLARALARVERQAAA